MKPNDAGVSSQNTPKIEHQPPQHGFAPMKASMNNGEGMDFYQHMVTARTEAACKCGTTVGSWAKVPEQFSGNHALVADIMGELCKITNDKVEHHLAKSGA